MPIKPENKKRYPQNWKKIRADILKRANNRCEFCGIENYSIRENGSKVVLTIAHLDHTPENCDYGNLRALCQKCHNNYDKEHRAETRRKTREERDVIHKTIDGYETTVHPSMEQAAIDQGIRPAGYDAPITPIDGCCAYKCKAFLDGNYRRGQVDARNKMLKLIEQQRLYFHVSVNNGWWSDDMPPLKAFDKFADRLRSRVEELTEDEQ